MNPRVYTAEREKLEQDALKEVCACWYYDLADSIDAMGDDELKDIIANGVPCENCQV